MPTLRTEMMMGNGDVVHQYESMNDFMNEWGDACFGETAYNNITETTYAPGKIIFEVWQYRHERTIFVEVAI